MKELQANADFYADFYADQFMENAREVHRSGKAIDFKCLLSQTLCDAGREIFSAIYASRTSW